MNKNKGIIIIIIIIVKEEPNLETIQNLLYYFILNNKIIA